MIYLLAPDSKKKNLSMVVIVGICFIYANTSQLIYYNSPYTSVYLICGTALFFAVQTGNIPAPSLHVQMCTPM